MVEALKKLDKKFLIIAGCVILIPIFVIVFLAIVQGCSGGTITYEKYEQKMISAAQKYFADKNKINAIEEFVKYVNWEGNPIDYTPPEYKTLDVPVDTLRDPIAEEVIRDKKLEEILIVYYNGRYQPDKCESHRVEVDALEELRQLAGEENLLPIPVGVPDGFKLVKSHVFFGSKKGTTYQLMGEEYVEAGVSVKRYACDPEKLRMCSYFLYFQNEAGERLNFSARMVMDYNVDSVLQADGGQVNVKKVEGMDQVVHIDRGEEQFIWMRENLLEPVPAQIMILGPDDIEISDVERSYVCLEIQANSTVCDLDTMLSCFGFTAQ